MVVAFVGCGRGGILNRVVIAGQNCKKKLRIYAVEKNYNTQAYLEMKFAKHKDVVSFHFTDVRTFKPEEECDMLVSELLGSFGDNELSPECLDWSEHLLKKDGISIPYRYSNFLAPMTSSYLHNAVQ